MKLIAKESIRSKFDTYGSRHVGFKAAENTYFYSNEAFQSSNEKTQFFYIYFPIKIIIFIQLFFFLIWQFVFYNTNYI